MTSPQLCVLLVLLPGLPCPTAAGDAQLGGEAARLAAVMARDAGDALLGSLLGRQDQAGNALAALTSGVLAWLGVEQRSLAGLAVDLMLYLGQGPFI